MANVTINDLSAASVVTDSMQLEVDTGGITSEKVTATQIKSYIKNDIPEIALISAAPTAPPDPLPATGTAAIAVETSTPHKLWVYSDSWHYVEMTAAAPPTPSSTVLMINPNSTNGSTTFTDESSLSHSLTYEGTTGTFEHSTAVVQSGYGSTSIRIAGISSNTDVKRIEVPFNNAWIIDDLMCFEGWFYYSGDPNVTTIFSRKSSSVNYFEIILAYGGLYWLDDNNSSGVALAASVATNQWTHFAATVNGTELKCYLDGTLESTETIATPPTGGTEPLIIGAFGSDSNAVHSSQNQASDAYLGPLRISKGDLIYTANFTPPSGPFV